MMGKTILVVDDEIHITQIVAFKLKKAGAKVLVACNGQEGLELARAHRPDLILTDFQMPLLDGFGMAVQLREDPATADIGLILLTARGHKLSAQELARTNIQMVMAKPFSARELADNARDLLRKSKASGSDDLHDRPKAAVA